MIAVSVIIPVYNGAATLERCLDSVFRSNYGDFEVVIVDDASTDSSVMIASRFPCLVVRLEQHAGPAKARNLGARVSKGEILFFTDADVILLPHTIERAVAILSERVELAGVIGSYTKETPERNFVSQYKNLLHHYTHQTCTGDVASFFTACGVIRRTAFDAIGGYDVSITTTALEDVELGYRLFYNGQRIFLDRHLQVSHLKSYTFWSLLRSDLFGRAIPYTKLMLKHRIYKRELSTQNHNVLSVIAVYLLLLLSIYVMFWGRYFQGALVALILATLLLVLNRDFYGFLWRETGWLFTLRSILMQWWGYFYSGVGLGVGALSYIISSIATWFQEDDESKKTRGYPFS